jgi:hypothetical protein
VDIPGPAVDAAMMGTRLTERFGIRHLIVCAPMALVTGGVAACTGGNSRVGYAYRGIRSGLPVIRSESMPSAEMTSYKPTPRCSKPFVAAWCHLQ